MTLLVLSPDFASHYGPLSAVAAAARDQGERVIIATGDTMRSRVVADRFDWRELRLGEASNAGTVERTPAIDAFLAATRAGPIATLVHQADRRGSDLLWRPEQVMRRIAVLCDSICPDRVLVDHVSFGSTLAMYATGRPFVSLVPGHPTQLPIGDEQYGIPPLWPSAFMPQAIELVALERLVERVTEQFTARWNRALLAEAPNRPPVDDAFRVHGDLVLYNSLRGLADPGRLTHLPEPHRFVGPLVRDETLPPDLEPWTRGDVDRVYVALGTFLAHRTDVLVTVVDALRRLGVRAAVSIGSTDPSEFGEIPDDWIVRPTLPQVGLLQHADLAIHHGGNNSVQESLAAGARQLVLPFSTDQFATAADLERLGGATAVPPNELDASTLVETIRSCLARPAPEAVPALSATVLAGAIVGAPTE